ncbi:MAG: DUF421 domain-containing protein [Acidimicrobiales bacterium]
MIASITNDLFTMGVPIAEKAIRTVAVYGTLLVLLRLAGKRELAQLNSFDFVVLLLLSNVVQNAVIGADNSLVGGLLGAVILIAGNAALVRVVERRDTLLRVFAGAPTTLVRDGRIDDAALRQLALRRADVMRAVRQQGANELREVAEATLEPGGTISVRLHADAMDATRADLARLEAKLDRLLERPA